MTTTEIILMVALFVVHIINWATMHSQSKTIGIYKKMLDDHRGDTADILKYCLTRIMNDSAQNEDYDTAKRCYDLLKKLNDLAPSPEKTK